jgi:hypothetical protein
VNTNEDRLGKLNPQASRLEANFCLQRIGLIALACVVLLGSGCLPRFGDRENYTDWKFRGMPVRRAYHDYWEGAGQVSDALLKPRFSVDAPRNTFLAVQKVGGAYRDARLSAHDFFDRTSPFLEDAKKMRADADSLMKIAMESFQSQSEILRKGLSNYYEIEAKVLHANELARIAFESNGTQ